MARRRGFSLADIARWMSAVPGRRWPGCRPRGGSPSAGDADFVAFDPDASWTVRGRELLHKHPVTPYDGRTLTGRVSRVWLGGAEVTPDDPPRGRLLARGGGPLGG